MRHTERGKQSREKDETQREGNRAGKRMRPERGKKSREKDETQREGNREGDG